MNTIPYHPTSTTDYLKAASAIGVATLLAGAMFPYFEPSNLIMAYLVAVVVVATRLGQGASILASLLSVAAFDFFFVHPYLTFTVSDTQYLLTFAVMLLVALTISTLTAEVREQVAQVRQREERTASLYRLSHAFANQGERDDLIRTAVAQLRQHVAGQVAVLLVESVTPPALTPTPHTDTTPYEQGVALWVLQHQKAAGMGTDVLPGARGLYLPLMTSGRILGVVGVLPEESATPFSAEQRDLLTAMVNQTALALERAQLADEAHAHRLQIEAERLRNALLSSISHDFRTPLASITGAASTLIEAKDPYQEGENEGQSELYHIILEEAERLNRLVGNLLEMTRLESGVIRLEKQWDLLEEVIGSTLLRMQRRLSQHRFEKHLPRELVLVPMDSNLIEQVLVNLLENALKYSPADSLITLRVEARPDEVLVTVMDEGAGIPPGLEERIFEKFYRAAPENVGGSGLGLAICRSIVEAHGGRIWAENRPVGGSIFRFTLPVEGQAPEVQQEDE